MSGGGAPSQRPPANAAGACVEICVEDVAGTRAAERGGTQRVELCADLLEGGLTPSLGMMRAVRRALSIPVVALIRPRPGNFVYDADELEAMAIDVGVARDEGLAGVALGVLDSAREIARGALLGLVERARPMDVVFHRAFDLVSEPTAALRTLGELGVARVLSSGQAASACAGIERLRSMAQAQAVAPELVLAGGVRPHNVASLVQGTGIHRVHASALRERAGSGGEVTFGVAAGGGHHWRETDEDQVRALVRAARAARAARPG